jgi:acetolactate synthase-1/2/3 large subunit
MVNALKAAGVTTIFGIPSIHNIGFYEALRKEPSIRHVLCRHESGATHMADGYARAGQGVGVVVTSTGPGAGYMVSPLIEAFWSSSPVLAVASNIKSSKIGRGIGTLHEFENQDAMFRTITKAVFLARSGDDLGLMTQRAVAAALSGRPGPVYLEVPVDVWDEAAGEGSEGGDFSGGTEAAGAEPQGLETAADRLRRAERPVIVAGTDAVRAGLGPEITALAEALYAPVATVAGGKGLLPEDHPLAFGNVTRRGPLRKLLAEADATLAIGIKLREADTIRRGLVLPNLIHADWDERWIGRNFQTEAAVVGDLRAAARALQAELADEPLPEERRDWVRAFRQAADRESARAREDQAGVRYIEAVRAAMPREAALVVDNTMLGYFAEYFYTSYLPGGLVPAKGSSIIGFAFPAAIGQKLARPDRPVAALIGDGGFMYGAAELATCVRHGVGFPVIVVNDGAFGVIDLLQRQSYGAGFENRLVNPDFSIFAASFGVPSTRVESPEELGAALEAALALKEMHLIELRASFGESPFARY